MCAYNILILLFVIFLLFHRSRKRKQEDESDEEDFDEDEDDYASSDDEDCQSDDASSDDEDEFSDGEEGDNRVTPILRDIYECCNKSSDADQRSLFQSIDGDDKIFETINSWHKVRTSLSWEARGVLVKGQKSLVSKQRKRSITLARIFGRSSKLSQVPYRKLVYLLLILP